VAELHRRLGRAGQGRDLEGVPGRLPTAWPRSPRRRWRAFTFLAALLATTLSFATFASAHTDDVTVLHLTTVVVENQAVDAAPTSGEPSLGDQLTLQGLGFDQPRNVFAITGGTGRWRNAGGQAVVRDVSESGSAVTLFISDLG
jgi:hypothetical protein